MEFFEVLARRHSIRAYLERGVEEEKINKILRAANSAPSAGNLQAYEIVLVRSKERRRALAEAALRQDFIAQAPVVLVFLINPARTKWRYGLRGEHLYCIQDATIAASYAQLAATALGLGSVWVGAFDTDRVAEIVGAGKELTPIAILAVGYPGEEPEPTPRRKLSDLVHEERVRKQWGFI
jgi:nitroreductase